MIVCPSTSKHITVDTCVCTSTHTRTHKSDVAALQECTPWKCAVDSAPFGDNHKSFLIPRQSIRWPIGLSVCRPFYKQSERCEFSQVEEVVTNVVVLGFPCHLSTQMRVIHLLLPDNSPFPSSVDVSQLLHHSVWPVNEGPRLFTPQLTSIGLNW